MYIVTGAAGLIGSAFIAELNSRSISDIIIVDELGDSEKWKNLKNKSFLDYLHKDAFLKKIQSGQTFKGLKAIVHMGACSSTTERDVDYLMQNNYHYTRELCSYALKRKLRFIYASSAATYGDGAKGYADDDAISPTLEPLNPYGFSKQLFDLWALRERVQRKIVGLKFFNVFGPNEKHKGEMRSMVMKAHEQIKATGKLRLFRSHDARYADGEQKRDFIYVKDCTKIMHWLLSKPKVGGIFNLGTGQAHSWNELARAVFAALGVNPEIEYIDMPVELRSQYQYFTEAKMQKLKATGCPLKFTSLEDSILDYVKSYLETGAVL